MFPLERLQLRQTHAGCLDLRPDPGIREELQQQRVREPSVEDVRGGYAGPDRIDTRLQLGAHAALQAVERGADLGRGGLSDQRVGVGGVGQPAGDVGEEDHLVGAERARDRAGGLVGVDVVGVPVAVGADGGDHGDVVRGDVVEHVDVDMVDAPDEADVLASGRAAAGDAKQRAVVAAEPDRGLAVAVDAQHDLGVDLADEHHLCDLDGRLVGDAQPADKLDGQSETLHVGGDVGAAAVHDDRVQADVLEQHDVARELLAQRLVLHRGAAVLDDDGLAVKLPDVRESLQQRAYIAHARAPFMSCTPR